MKDSTAVELQAEITRARKKFPSTHKLLAALFEEGGELAKAMLQRRPLSDVQKEAIQVACVAIRIYEEGDADFDKGEWGDAP